MPKAIAIEVVVFRDGRRTGVDYESSMRWPDTSSLAEEVMTAMNAVDPAADTDDQRERRRYELWIYRAGTNDRLTVYRG